MRKGQHALSPSLFEHLISETELMLNNYDTDLSKEVTVIDFNDAIIYSMEGKTIVAFDCLSEEDFVKSRAEYRDRLSKNESEISQDERY